MHILISTFYEKKKEKPSLRFCTLTGQRVFIKWSLFCFCEQVFTFFLLFFCPVVTETTGSVSGVSLTSELNEELIDLIQRFHNQLHDSQVSLCIAL